MPVQRLGSLVLALVLGAGCVLPRGGDGGGNVTGPEARQLVAAGARLVDVRTPEEFAERHLPGAINIPVQELARRMGELEPRDRPLVLYCRSGSRSARAAKLLGDAGFGAVHDLGAIGRW